MNSEIRGQGAKSLERIACASILAVSGALTLGGCTAVLSDKEGVSYNQLALAMSFFGLCAGYATPYVSAWIGSKIKRRNYTEGISHSS